MRSALAAVAAATLLISACNRDTHEAPSVVAQTASAASLASASTNGAIPHGDHNPKFGGLVLMNGDLHFEVVMHRDGGYRVYFSDATRAELPAATASGLTLAVTEKGRPTETVPMHIDDSGESWTGKGHPVQDLDASVRVTYTVHDKPYFIDVPFPK